MPEFLGWAFSDLIVTGPDPFRSNASANGSSVGASTITVAEGVRPTRIEMTDDDPEFSDGDSDQRYLGPADFNGGIGYEVGDRIETEYSYIIRPAGSNDPADNITIYMLEIDADGQGIAADVRLVQGVTYDIIAVDSSDPVVEYSNLYVCFASGTQIETPYGEEIVDDLRVGDLIATRDCGPMSIRWIGQRRLSFPDAPERQKPIEFKPGSLGKRVPKRRLMVSPQHCLLGRSFDEFPQKTGSGVLVKAKDLLDRRGVRRMKGCRRVTYFSILLDSHQIIYAEGAAVESFFPGAYSLGILSTAERSELYSLFPRLMVDPDAGYGDRVLPVQKSQKVQKEVLCAGDRHV